MMVDDFLMVRVSSLTHIKKNSTCTIGFLGNGLF